MTYVNQDMWAGISMGNEVLVTFTVFCEAALWALALLSLIFHWTSSGNPPGVGLRPGNLESVPSTLFCEKAPAASSHTWRRCKELRSNYERRLNLLCWTHHFSGSEPWWTNCLTPVDRSVQQVSHHSALWEPATVSFLNMWPKDFFLFDTDVVSGLGGYMLWSWFRPVCGPLQVNIISFLLAGNETKLSSVSNTGTSDHSSAALYVTSPGAVFYADWGLCLHVFICLVKHDMINISL